MNKPSIVFIGTYPPRECGIATFTQDLLNGSQKFLEPEVVCKVAAFNVSPLDKHVYPPEVEWEIDQNSKKDHLDLAKSINFDQSTIGVILEHEYGIFGGKDGENILYFMEKCQKPIVVTLHTVLPKPTNYMKKVTKRIIARADSIVVLTNNSKEMLEMVYPTARGKVEVVPHGIHQVPFADTTVAKKKLKLSKFQVLSTFGLLSRGKGIEFVIKALPEVVKKNPNVLYLILGKTHPVVRRDEGESYRKELTNLVTNLKLEKNVRFYDHYLKLKPDLFRFLKATDIYVSTSINADQAVSGTLSYALGTGRAVVSTKFPQANEIVSPEVGRLVPTKDWKTMSRALNELLDDKKKLKIMHRKAYEITRPMLWDNVASQYLKLLAKNTIPEIKLDHLDKMTDNFGLFQFSDLDKPNKKFGYTIDDNARALIVCSQLVRLGYKKKTLNLAKIYLSFIKKCQLPSGDFLNYISFKNKLATPQNKLEDLKDANSRTLWALAEILANNSMPKTMRDEAKVILKKAIPSINNHEHLRAKATTIKALIISRELLPEIKSKIDLIIKKYTQEIMESFGKNSVNQEWQWVDQGLNYNNGIIPESLFWVGEINGEDKYTEVAQKCLDFLVTKTLDKEYYAPIGNLIWYRQGEVKSEYDQQPEDPAAMILALTKAYEVTRNKKYKDLARICFSWFMGNNNLGKPIYNHRTSGCYDGLTPNGVNLNQGAESLVSYLLARLAIDKLNSNENSTK